MSFTIEAKEKPFIRHTNLPRFRHLDFATLPGEMAFRQDPDSQIISQHRDTPMSVDEETQFHSKEYATATMEEQLFFDPSTNQRRTRAQLLAAAISKNISAPRRILDIGCSHGTLLIELSKYFPSAELHGMDVNPDFQPALSRASITFHDSLDGVNSTFDLITSSHTLMYLSSLTELARQLNAVMCPESVIVLAVPDYAVNPSQLLLGDQHYYFNEASLLEFCGPLGEPKILRLEALPHELVCVVRRGNATYPNSKDPAEKTLELALKELTRVSDIIRGIDEQVAVLGTSTVAAFVDEVFPAGAAMFVDESVLKSFRGRPVEHPKMFQKDMPILLAYGARNKGIRERFRKRYQIDRFLLM